MTQHSDVPLKVHQQAVERRLVDHSHEPPLGERAQPSFVHLLELRFVIVIPREQFPLEPDARDVVVRIEPNACFEDAPFRSGGPARGIVKQRPGRPRG